MQKGKLILENGTVFEGERFGSMREMVAEIVFNTSMAGYQEIITDPSYKGQMVCMTYPWIGSYGTNNIDQESDIVNVSALICKDYNDKPSNWRNNRTLGDKLRGFSVPGLSGVDTRALTRVIRHDGAMKAMITDFDTVVDEALLKRIKDWEFPKDVIKRVTCRKPIEYPVKNEEFHVVAIDCGIKRNIITELNLRNIKVTRVPFNTSAKEILAYNPDGVFSSNGPGDPTWVPETIETLKQLTGKKPIFGICLGHQLLTLAHGGQTTKMKFGHRGASQPVMNVDNNKVEITTQNHSFMVVPESLKNTDLEITHTNLTDHTVEGIKNVEQRIFAVQYHPESCPGPEDSKYLFDKFVRLMKGGKE